MAQKVRKAVIAAAGMGTRFLPQTKAMPKEMLPLIDKPIIQYVVEELVSAGIEDIIIVTGYSKRSIEDHFDVPNQDLVENLLSGGESKRELLDQIKSIPNFANFIYLRQKGPYGNATPVKNAAHLIGDEPFIYTFADDFFVSNPASFQQMVSLYEKTGASVLPCIRATKEEDYDRYGFVGGSQDEEGITIVDKIVEKPGKNNSPSNLASVSGYLFTSDIFDYIGEAPKKGEHLIQDGITRLVKNNLPVVAFEVKNSTYYDTGNKLEYLKTVFDFALNDPQYSNELKDFIRNKLDK